MGGRAPVSFGGALVITNILSTPAGVPHGIVDNDGVDPVNGTSFGLPEGSFIANGGAAFQISYAGWPPATICP